MLNTRRLYSITLKGKNAVDDPDHGLIVLRKSRLLNSAGMLAYQVLLMFYHYSFVTGEDLLSVRLTAPQIKMRDQVTCKILMDLGYIQEANG